MALKVQAVLSRPVCCLIQMIQLWVCNLEKEVQEINQLTIEIQLYF